VISGAAAAGFSRIFACKLRRRTSVSTFCISEKEVDVDLRHFAARRVAAALMGSFELRGVNADSPGFEPGEIFDPVSIS